MGIPHLTKLVNRTPGVYLEQSFNNSRLVIDGSNLVYHLYFSSGQCTLRGSQGQQLIVMMGQIVE